MRANRVSCGNVFTCNGIVYYHLYYKPSSYLVSNKGNCSLSFLIQRSQMLMLSCVCFKNSLHLSSDDLEEREDEEVRLVTGL